MPSRDVPGILRHLAHVPLFEGVPDETLARIVGLAHSKEIESGSFFFSEGDPAESFFVLTNGRVKLTQLTPEGHQIALRLVGPGDAFGGVGAFGDPTYPVSALHFVARRLHDLQRLYRQAMTERVERRVARALLRLCHDAGRRVETGVEITFPISRQDIAEMTGTSLYTVSRLLSSWEERRILHSGRQRIVLTNPHALVAIAEDLPDRQRSGR
jgi:CRP/FNR family transcriptional regulator, nitrogen oxide reductase regulator